jgi:hypothetical protein
MSDLIAVGFKGEDTADHKFIRSVGSTIEPGSSALFVLVRSVTADKVLPELQPFEGTVLVSSSILLRRPCAEHRLTG